VRSRLCTATCRKRWAKLSPCRSQTWTSTARLQGVILFESSVPDVIRLPVPRHLRGVLAAILILRNPNYPRRFLQDIDPSEGNFSSSLENSLLSLIRCPEERWHQLQTWNTPLFSRHSPLIVASKILGWPFELNLTSLPTLLTEGPSLVMSIFPRQDYNVISHSSRLIRGLLMVASIFAPNTPRRALQSSTKPWLGFVQGLPDRFNILRFKTLLITGLAVESSYHRRGFGRGLIFAVVCRMWDCEEIWIAVHEENYAMFSLYSKCGFWVRKRHWDLSMEISNM